MAGIENRMKKCHCVATFTRDTHTLTNVHSSGEARSERCSKTRSGTDGGSKRDQRRSMFHMESDEIDSSA